MRSTQLWLFMLCALLTNSLFSQVTKEVDINVTPRVAELVDLYKTSPKYKQRLKQSVNKQQAQQYQQHLQSQQSQVIQTGAQSTQGSTQSQTQQNSSIESNRQSLFNSAQQYENGQLYYNAVPSTPAPGSSIKVIDTKDHTDYICKIYTMKYKVGPEVREFLKTTVLKEGGEVDTTVNTETGVNYLIVTAPIFQFPYLDEVVRVLDQPGTSWDNSGNPSVTYKMKHRLASEAMKFIIGAQKLSRDGTVYADDKINIIYICDTPTQYMDAKTSLNDVDVPPEMVRIKAEIVEIEMNDDFNFGLDLDAWKEMLPETIDMSFNFEQAKKNAIGTGFIGNPEGTAKYVANSLNINGIRPKAVANLINYMITRGKAKVLSRPTVVALNGELANISSLDKISYKSYSTKDEDLIKQAEVGVALTIKPVIGTETVTLDIKAKVNSLMGWSSDSSPLINSRSTQAHVIMKDKELFVLSGLRKDTVTKMDERVPILGSIPLVGYLFRHEVDVKKTYEIVVLLTPEKVTPTTARDANAEKLRNETEKEFSAPPTHPVFQFIDRAILNKF